MKTIFTTLILFILALHFTYSQQNKPKNVFDYYIELPDAFFACELSPKIDKQFKEGIITHKNIKNGYLLALVENMKLQIALFKDKVNQRDIIAVALQCGPGCMCNHYEFLIQSNNAWKDITTEILPNLDSLSTKITGDADLHYQIVLPEFGTTIKILNSDSQKLLFELEWKSGKFYLKQEN